MRALILALLTSFSLSAPLQAQEQQPVFDSYEDMRRVMDQLIVTRQVQELMVRFGGGDEMTVAQLNDLDATVERLYPNNFENVAVMRRLQHGGGFTQELLVYWTGLNYLYVYVFYHDRGGEVVSINFRFNSDYAKLTGLF
ncbi:hypothetical protein [Pacificoceanicola onchidii]|uniref:hypothetical protein n=1 Tax=Pacificoceanicola onchidii TaxID=2562685 RepID=UPI0010A68D12|nr:hypothetical protein [Pacificoceanicola onchidii]